MGRLTKASPQTVVEVDFKGKVVKEIEYSQSKT
jgi:hypothetical protein